MASTTRLAAMRRAPTCVIAPPFGLPQVAEIDILPEDIVQFSTLAAFMKRLA